MFENFRDPGCNTCYAFSCFDIVLDCVFVSIVSEIVGFLRMVGFMSDLQEALKEQTAWHSTFALT